MTDLQWRCDRCGRTTSNANRYCNLCAAQLSTAREYMDNASAFDSEVNFIRTELRTSEMQKFQADRTFKQELPVRWQAGSPSTGASCFGFWLFSCIVLGILAFVYPDVSILFLIMGIVVSVVILHAKFKYDEYLGPHA